MNQVQTYIVDEVEELIYDTDKLDRWNNLINKLDLKGQQSISSKDNSPNPFLYLKQSMINIFSELCPVKTDITEYDKSPIPVEIMDLVALAINEKYFEVIEIWYDDKTPDPVCIGKTGYWSEMQWYDNSNKEIKNHQYDSKQEVLDAGGNHPSFYTKDTYIIGRWGDVARDFEELKQMAIESFKTRESVELNNQIRRANRDLEDLETRALERFN
jgi:hypothetical protein